MPAKAAAKARTSMGWRTGRGMVVAVELEGESGGFWFIERSSGREAGREQPAASRHMSIYRSPGARLPQARRAAPRASHKRRAALTLSRGPVSLQNPTKRQDKSRGARSMGGIIQRHRELKQRR